MALHPTASDRSLEHQRTCGVKLLASRPRSRDLNIDKAVRDGQRPNRVDLCPDRGNADQRRRDVQTLHTDTMP